MGEKRERIIGVERGGEEREEECLEGVQGGEKRVLEDC